MEKQASNILKSYPTTIQKDVLLDKFARGELTLPEMELLRTILGEEFKKESSNAAGKQLAYIMIIARLEQLIYEYKEKKC